jgi:hypothetical protein
MTHESVKRCELQKREMSRSVSLVGKVNQEATVSFAEV